MFILQNFDVINLFMLNWNYLLKCDVINLYVKPRT